MFSFFSRRSERKQCDNQKAPETGIIVQGSDYIAHDSIVVDKKVSGDFYALNRLAVEADAFVTGNIYTTDAEIKGRVNGDILCRKSLTIRGTAIIAGNITTARIEIEPGALINGTIALMDAVSTPALIEKVKQAAQTNAKAVISSINEDVTVKDDSYSRPAPVKAMPQTAATPPAQAAVGSSADDGAGWW
ncbi:MAG TPA: polymer-forming cytoskeletal protein [Sphingobacteriaceae bacterium]